ACGSFDADCGGVSGGRICPMHGAMRRAGREVRRRRFRRGLSGRMHQASAERVQGRIQRADRPKREVGVLYVTERPVIGSFATSKRCKGIHFFLVVVPDAVRMLPLRWGTHFLRSSPTDRATLAARRV